MPYFLLLNPCGIVHIIFNSLKFYTELWLCRLNINEKELHTHRKSVLKTNDPGSCVQVQVNTVQFFLKVTRGQKTQHFTDRR